MGVKIKFDSKKLERQIKEQSLKIAKQDIIKNGT
ncbi:TPA: adenylate kinase, partial [Listeria monocytogenes]|nr:adenylate kinase [Listeria monocytogenes]